MGMYREIGRDHGWRVLFAGPCFAVGGFFFFTSGSAGMLFSLPFLLGGAIILAPLVTTLLAEPFRALFYPVERFDRPQPMYGIPESKRANGLYEEAITGFEKIAQDYPGEVKPYLEMIDILIVDLKDPERAKGIYERGVSFLKKDEDKQALSQMYGVIRTRLNAKPTSGIAEPEHRDGLKLRSAGSKEWSC